MDTMETIDVASGLSTEVKMLVAVCVVLATMLVLTMVSFPSQPREQPERNAAQRTHLRCSTHTHRNRRRRRHTHPTISRARA